MAAYVGPRLRLDRFLLEPEHNLVEQAHDPRELNYAHLNADGFGIGWYADDGLPAVYLNPMPIWTDPNLWHLGRTLTSDLWVANIRSATPGFGVELSNTQPFHDDSLLYMHNGFVREFQQRLRPILQRYLEPSIHAGIRGSTDSEYLFAVLRQTLLCDEVPIDSAILRLLELVQEWVPDTQAMLNFVVTSGRTLYAARHALNEPCPSLYYTTDDERFPGGQLIASERLTESDYWNMVPEHSLLILGPDEPPELRSL